MKEFLEGVVGVVEANSFETLCLWQKHTDGGKRNSDTWVQHLSGPLVTVGHMDTSDKRYPVCISLFINEVNGRKILFLEATSIVVNWDMISTWLIENLPKTAFRDNGYINKTNAMNFFNLLS